MAKSITDISVPKSDRKAIGYARVSTEKQKSDGNSIDVQKEAIRNYVNKNGLFLIDTLVESKSASKVKKSFNKELLTNRPILQDILDKAKKHEFTDLILYSRDRLARNFAESIAIKGLFIKCKIIIHYVSTSETLSEKNAYIDKFTDLVFSNIAMLEAGLIGQRAKSGQKINIENGFYAGGPVPYGYNIEPHDIEKKKIFIKDATEEVIIKRIFTLYNLRFSYSEIIEMLKKEFPCETNISFTKSTLSQIINNEIYTGSLIWNRKSKHQLGENDTIVRSMPSDKVQIISSELFSKIHAIKSSKEGINNMSYKSSFLLKGKLICGNCNKSLKAKNNGKGKKNVYYCSCNSKNLSSNKIKWSISIPQDKLENYILNLIHTNLEKPINDTKLLEKYYLIYSSSIESEKKDTNIILNMINIELKEIENTIDNASETLENEFLLKKENKDLYTDNLFESIKNAISLVNIRKIELEQQIKESKKILKLNAMTFEQFNLDFNTIASTLLNINSLKTKELSLSDHRLKRMLIDDIIDKIIVNYGVNGETLSIYLKIPNISTAHNFEFLQTCPIHNILSI